MGDPAGIGGELSLRTWLALRTRAARSSRWTIPTGWTALPATSAWTCRSGRRDAVEAAEVFRDGPAGPARPPRRATRSRANPIQPTPPAVVASIEQATALALPARRPAMVTNPINKAALYQAGFPYPGHTEFLAALTGATRPADHDARQPDLRVVPVTVHASLRGLDRHADDRRRSSPPARTTAAALRRDFGIAAPRLAIAGLNPHAGEQGALGDEETTLIPPGDRHAARRGDRRLRPLAARHHVHRRRARALRCRRSACITIRR